MARPTKYPHCNAQSSATRKTTMVPIDHSVSTGTNTTVATASTREAAKTDGTRSRKPRTIPTDTTLAMEASQSICRSLPRLPLPLQEPRPTHESPAYDWMQSRKTGYPQLPQRSDHSNDQMWPKPIRLAHLLCRTRLYNV